MQTSIKEPEGEIIFSNDSLDNANFVDIIVKNKYHNDFMISLTIPVDELVAAALAFQNLRDFEMKRNNNQE